jgi:hypothetical protein
LDTLVNGVRNGSVPPSFMLNDGRYAFHGFRIIYGNYGKAENLYVYQFPGKADQIFINPNVINNITNQVETNCFVLIQSYDKTATIWEKIKDRLAYLDEIFDEEENKKKYQFTKQILLDVLRCFRLKKQPLIGIDDNGQIGASWYNGFDYKIISIIPHRENNISVSCIMKTGKILQNKTTLAQIKSKGTRELTQRLGELPW